MAQRRMFSKAIIGSGKFLRMPPTARLLYYDLGMEADDDGVVEAFRVMRTTGATDDDLKILIAKGFVKLLNEELVILICDWKINNFIRTDRYQSSVYSDLLQSVNCSDLVYQPDTNGIPNGNQMDTQDRIGKESIGKTILLPTPTPKEQKEEKEEKADPVPYAKIAEHFKTLCPSYPAIRGIAGERKVKVTARWKENPDLEIFDTLFRTAEASDFMKGKINGWKADFDWMMIAGNFNKILEGKYDNKPAESKGSFDTEEFFQAALMRSYADYNTGENAEK